MVLRLFQALSEVVWLEERPRAGAGLLAAGTKRPPRPEAEEAEEAEETGAEAEEERRLKLLKERVEWCVGTLTDLGTRLSP